jgi:preprotein translocase subunit SecE
MDTAVKKTEPSKVVQSVNTVKEFTGDIKAELGKINWTSPEELRFYTQLVVGATFLLGMGLYGIDLLIQGVLNSLTFIVRLLG